MECLSLCWSQLFKVPASSSVQWTTHWPPSRAQGHRPFSFSQLVQQQKINRKRRKKTLMFFFEADNLRGSFTQKKGNLQCFWFSSSPKSLAKVEQSLFPHAVDLIKFRFNSLFKGSESQFFWSNIKIVAWLLVRFHHCGLLSQYHCLTCHLPSKIRLYVINSKLSRLYS